MAQFPIRETEILGLGESIISSLILTTDATFLCRCDPFDTNYLTSCAL